MLTETRNNPRIRANAVSGPARLGGADGDAALDEAIRDIIESGEAFTSPNVNLLVESVMGARWD